MLKTDCSTRWNSTHKMMKRVLEQQAAIKRVLVDDPKTAHLLAGWWQTEEVLKDVTTALDEYENLTDALSGETHVTVSSILPLLFHVCNLSQHAEEDESVSQLQKDIYKNVADYMKPRFVKDDRQLVQFLGCSTVLDPRYKEFMVQEYNEEYVAVKLQIIEEAKVYLDDMLRSDCSSSATSATSGSQSQISTSTTKPSRGGGRKLAEILQSVTASSHAQADTSMRSTIKKEFELYMPTPAPSLCGSSADTDTKFNNPLLWWKKQIGCFPNLAHVAKKYLCVGATSVSSERMFSKSGNILNKKRNKTSPRMANMLVFLNANYHLQQKV